MDELIPGKLDPNPRGAGKKPLKTPLDALRAHYIRSALNLLGCVAVLSLWINAYRSHQPQWFMALWFFLTVAVLIVGWKQARQEWAHAKSLYESAPQERAAP